MKKTRKNYTREFKLEAVRLLETSGKSAAQIERDLGIGSGCLGRWKREFAAEGEHAFPGHGRLTPDQEHIRQLERGRCAWLCYGSSLVMSNRMHSSAISSGRISKEIEIAFRPRRTT